MLCTTESLFHLCPTTSVLTPLVLVLLTHNHKMMAAALGSHPKYMHRKDRGKSGEGFPFAFSFGKGSLSGICVSTFLARAVAHGDPELCEWPRWSQCPVHTTRPGLTLCRKLQVWSLSCHPSQVHETAKLIFNNFVTLETKSRL